MESNSDRSTSDSGSVAGERGESSRRGRGRGSRGGLKRAARGRGRGRGRRQTVQPAALPETEDERKERMKNLIDEMSEEKAKEVLLEVVEKQPGIIFDILDVVGNPGGYHPQPGQTAPQWCVCGNCREMPSADERVCCGYIPQHCISLSPDMDRYILDQGVLAIARTYRNDVLVHPNEIDENKANRYAAYRQFTLWLHGRLGPGIRRVIPSCCTWRIRDKFPNPFGQYTGFVAGRLG